MTHFLPRVNFQMLLSQNWVNYWTFLPSVNSFVFAIVNCLFFGPWPTATKGCLESLYQNYHRQKGLFMGQLKRDDETDFEFHKLFVNKLARQDAISEKILMFVFVLQQSHFQMNPEVKSQNIEFLLNLARAKHVRRRAPKRIFKFPKFSVEKSTLKKR